MKIILLSCVKGKAEVAAPAREMYTSLLFKLSLRYAQMLADGPADKIFILSAKYGVLGLDEVIKPYLMTLKSFTERELERWANRVLVQLRGKLGQEFNFNEAEFILLLGKPYRKYLIKYFNNFIVPMFGLGFGQQRAWLLFVLDALDKKI